MADMHDCTIEISNTNTIKFGYQRLFFSQFAFKSHLASNFLIVFPEYRDQDRSDDGKFGKRVPTESIFF